LDILRDITLYKFNVDVDTNIVILDPTGAIEKEDERERERGPKV